MIIRLAVSLPTTAIALALSSAALLLIPQWHAAIPCPALLVPQALVLAAVLTRTPSAGHRKAGTSRA